MKIKSAKLAFGVSVLAFTAFGGAQAEPTEAPITDDNTAIVTGKNAEASAPGKASFTINIGDLGLVDKVYLRTSPKTAVIFSGRDKDANRVCPFFNLNSRHYEIEEVQEDVYKVTTDVTDEDIEKVKKSGCVVTTRPNLKKIKYLNP